MSFVLSVFVKTSIVLFVAAGLSMALRRSSASLRHAVWITSLAGALLLPIAATFVPQLEWSPLPKPSVSVTFLPIDNPASTAGASRPLLKPDIVSPALTSRLEIAFVWLLGAALLIMRFGAGVIAVRGMAKRTMPIEGWSALI